MARPQRAAPCRRAAAGRCCCRRFSSCSRRSRLSGCDAWRRPIRSSARAPTLRTPTDLAAIEDHEVSQPVQRDGQPEAGPGAALDDHRRLAGRSTTPRDMSTRAAGLARVRTIHFARWVFLDGRKRILFLSNYDGSLESYMDDFINKVGFGLNVVFSNGIGYPRTDWLDRSTAVTTSGSSRSTCAAIRCRRRSGTRRIRD